MQTASDVSVSEDVEKSRAGCIAANAQIERVCPPICWICKPTLDIDASKKNPCWTIDDCVADTEGANLIFSIENEDRCRK